MPGTLATDWEKERKRERWIVIHRKSIGIPRGLLLITLLIIKTLGSRRNQSENTAFLPEERGSTLPPVPGKHEVRYGKQKQQYSGKGTDGS
ncbi:hypothetical protein Tco_0484453 [Tanacetum coccineum]